MNSNSNASFSSFRALGEALGHEIPVDSKGKKMDNVTQNKPLPEYSAVTKYYNHNKRYGFVFVTIPKDTVLTFDIDKTSENDDSPGMIYKTGEVADRNLVIEAFIHGSILERGGYEYGLEEGNELKVKIAKNAKGIQVVWTPPKDGVRPRSNNEPRKANVFLKFVPAIVKTYSAERNFGFVKISHNSETGEPLTNNKGEPVEIEAHFTAVALERAGYSQLKEGMEIFVKYYTREDGRSSVAQFKFPDANTDPDCVAKKSDRNQAA